MPANTLKLQFRDEDKVGAGSWAIIFSVINVLCTIYPLYFIGLQTKYLKSEVLRNQWILIDFFGCMGSIYVSICVFSNCGIEGNKTETAWHHYRVVAAITCILIMLKSLYFLKMDDNIAPLIFIIFKIISDIRQFMYVFFIILFSFMVAFYLIG